jgi:hypothetical protein
VSLNFDITNMTYEAYLDRYHQLNYHAYQDMLAQKQMELMAMTGGMMGMGPMGPMGPMGHMGMMGGRGGGGFRGGRGRGGGRY